MSHPMISRDTVRAIAAFQIHALILRRPGGRMADSRRPRFPSLVHGSHSPESVVARDECRGSSDEEQRSHQAGGSSGQDGKRNSKFDRNQTDELHEEKKLTTKAPKVFNQKYPNLRVLRDLRGEKAYDRKTINSEGTSGQCRVEGNFPSIPLPLDPCSLRISERR